MSRRTRQQEGVEGPTAKPALAQQEEESIAQRLERRRTELFEKRQLENIQEIEQELSEGAYASSIATGEESSSIGHKRAASTDLLHSTKRALASPVYKGTNLRELRDFAWLRGLLRRRGRLQGQESEPRQ
jgi:hypothetical protein